MMNFKTRRYIQNQLTDLNNKMDKMVHDARWDIYTKTNKMPHITRKNFDFPQWIIDARNARIMALKNNDISFIHNK